MVGNANFFKVIFYEIELDLKVDFLNNIKILIKNKNIL